MQLENLDFSDKVPQSQKSWRVSIYVKLTLLAQAWSIAERTKLKMSKVAFTKHHGHGNWKSLRSPVLPA